MKIKIKVTKASGRTEDLNPDKLRASLVRAGADKDRADDVIEKVLHEIEPYTSTKRIYRLAKRYLRQLNHAAGIRYSLKNALFRLGPSGYPFEKYFAEVLRNYGYSVDAGIILDGKCISHEVDVFATNDTEVSVVECKYHNKPGRAVDVKVAMYIHSRFRDLAPVLASRYPGKIFKGWLVTNTRCTSEAIRYAECADIHVKSWGYPQHESLEKMVEDKRLYPVTMLSGIKSGLIEKLIKKHVIILKDLSALEAKDLSRMLSLPENKAIALKKQVDELCLC